MITFNSKVSHHVVMSYLGQCNVYLDHLFLRNCVCATSYFYFSRLATLWSESHWDIFGVRQMDWNAANNTEFLLSVSFFTLNFFDKYTAESQLTPDRPGLTFSGEMCICNIKSAWDTDPSGGAIQSSESWAEMVEVLSIRDNVQLCCWTPATLW